MDIKQKTPPDVRLDYVNEDGPITEETRQKLLKALEPFRKRKEREQNENK